MRALRRGKSAGGLSARDAAQRTAAYSSSDGRMIGRGVTFGAYTEFWASLSLKSASELVAEVARRLVELGKPDARRRGTDVRKDHALEALVHALDFVHLFLDVDPTSPAFVEARKQWEGMSTVALSSPALARYNVIMRNLVSRHQRPETQLVNFALVDYVLEVDRGEMDIPSLFAFLRHVAHGGGEPERALYEALEKNLTGMIKAARRQPGKFLSTVMNMLHVLSELLVIMPPTHLSQPVLLRLAKYLASDLLYWPRPYAAFSVLVADLLAQEQADPGHALRSRLLRERPGLASESERPQAVLALYDQSDPRSRLLGEVCAAFRAHEASQESDIGSVGPCDLLENALALGLRFTDVGAQARLRGSIHEAPESRVRECLALAVPSQHAPRGHAAPEGNGEGEGEGEAAGEKDRGVALYERRVKALGMLDPGLRQLVALAKERRSGYNFTHWVAVPGCTFDFRPLLDSALVPLEHAPANRSAAAGAGAAAEPAQAQRAQLAQLAQLAPDHQVRLGAAERVVVVGGNECLHRVLCEYVRVVEREQREPTVFLVPVGRSDVGAFLARSDPWYRKHVFSPFSSQLKLCPPLESVEAGAAEGLEEHDSAAWASAVNPLRLHYDLLSDFVQGAKCVVALQVFECHCWKDEECSDDDAPDVVVPFLCRVELGLNAAVTRFLDAELGAEQGERARAVSGSSVSSTSSSSFFFMGSSDKSIRGAGGAGGASLWEEALADRNFLRSGIGPGLTPEVKVSLRGVRLDGSPSAKTTELTPAAYQALSVSNAAAYQDPGASLGAIAPQPYQAGPDSVRPTQGWLEVSWLKLLPSTQYVQELIKKRDKKGKDMEHICDAVRSEQKRFFGNAIDVTATKRQPFLVTIDGISYGPFFRIRVAKAACTLPVRTFTPVPSD